MKKRISALILALGMVAIPATSFADGNEKNEPEHSITDAHEGIEGGELFAAGAGLVLALGLAYFIGRRSNKKD
ncbi:MAG: hypothetical protein F2672_02320 [Actinobacteria bacterium]|jgi:hypothetical protein|uniref:Unannotated protein n=1 Tax=freshwater metagenome TaxID=449393 RepID=A0A6J6PN88_9ZZZZ|nr:hypothetical protein [Actinomycetota bacterium]